MSAFPAESRPTEGSTPQSWPAASTSAAATPPTSSSSSSPPTTSDSSISSPPATSPSPPLLPPLTCPPSLPFPVASSLSPTSLLPLASGCVHKATLRAGDGHIPPDKAVVTVHYIAYLHGHPIDSSYTRHSPYTFRLGTGAVLRGWDAAVASMSVGEVARFVVQPRYAYGEAGFTITHAGQALTSSPRGARSTPPFPLPPSSSPSSPSPSSVPPPAVVIPPNTPLVFLLELLSYTHTSKATEDGGVLKRILRHGTGPHRPNDGAVCRLRWRCRVQGSPTYFTPKHYWEGVEGGEGKEGKEGEGGEGGVEVEIGLDPHTLMGLEDGLKNMYEGELSMFTLSPSYGYGEGGNATLGVPGNATLELEVELLRFTKGVETWQLSDDGRVEWMRVWKARANASYEVGDVVRAVRKYVKVNGCFQYDEHLSEEQRRAVWEVKVACHHNLAMAKAKMGKAADVFKHCNEALRMDPNHVKSLYRRGVAYANM